MKQPTIVHFNNIRLDKYLTEVWNENNRSQITKMIKDGCISVNDKVITKPGFMVFMNDKVDFAASDISLSKILQGFAAPLKIEYEDDDLLIVYKPSGMLTHPTHFEEPDTLLNIVINYANGKYYPKLIHRLDKDTSGLVIFAKHDSAQQALLKMFENREIIKKYYAIVHGNPKHRHLLIDIPIARGNGEKLKMVAGEGKNVKNAVTEVNLLQAYHKYSLLDVTLHTGRTHQIRVHLKYLNLPIVNDPLYGIDGQTTVYNQFLMAYHLAFKQPLNNKEIKITIDLDQEFSTFLSTIELTKI